MKTRLMTLMACLFTAIMSLTAQEIATWDNWCSTAVTFTFEDGGMQTASHTWAAEQFDQHGFKGSFYLVTNWCNYNSWNDYKTLAQNGHEIGSHSVSHPNNCQGELNSSKEKIEDEIGQPCLTIVYPNDVYPGRTVLNYYIGGRLCDGSINSYSPADFSRIDAIICGSNGKIQTAEQFISKCEEADNRWVVFHLDGIKGISGGGTYTPTNQDAFLGTLDWLQQNKSTYWVTTMRDAIKYIQERNYATFVKYSQEASSVTYKLTLPTSLTSNTLCNWDYPLSLRVPLPSGWSDATVKQNNKTIASEIKAGKVYFKAVPNGGNIVLTKGTSISTNVENVPTNPLFNEDSWYTIYGVRLDGKPNTSGVYIHNGKTVIR
ncbi:MAG: polysaccharide deacetylase family protein [Prevotella sp.]|nr:polysaccharide deacetylase family protein [Prevotella sp.]